MSKLTISVILSFVIGIAPVYAERLIHLNPKESKSLTNNALWTLNVSCDIQSNASHHVIRVRVMERGGLVNGKSLSKGETTSVRLKNKEHLSISAEPGASVNIVNTGTEEIDAVCYT